MNKIDTIPLGCFGNKRNELKLLLFQKEYILFGMVYFLLIK